MTKGDFRLIINTGWPPDHGLAIVLSAAKRFYGREFTSKCVMSLYAVFKPLSVAVMGGSKSEVLAAVSESKERSQLLYDWAVAIAKAKRKSSYQGVDPSMITPELKESKPLDIEAQRPVEQEPANSQPLENLFEEDYD